MQRLGQTSPLCFILNVAVFEPVCTSSYSEHQMFVLHLFLSLLHTFHVVHSICLSLSAAGSV